MSNREDMIAEAIDFGLEFKGNISNKKLAAMLADFKGEPEPEEAGPAGPAMKPEESNEVEVEETISKGVEAVRQRTKDKYQRRREQVAKAKQKAMKTSVVTLTSKDSRENDVVTTAYLSVQNMYFSVARNVPLDIPVELEHCLIRCAETATITLHRDEIKNGRRTGNKVTARVPKYAISYSGIDPE